MGPHTENQPTNPLHQRKQELDAWAEAAKKAAWEEPSDELIAWASACLYSVGDNLDVLEAERKAETKPMHDAKKAVDLAYTAAMKQAEGALKSLRESLAGVALARRQRAQAAREEAFRLAAAGDTEGAQRALCELETTLGLPDVRVSFGYDYKVVDLAEVPRYLLKLDEEKVEGLCRRFGTHGPDAVPGIEFFETAKIARKPRKGE